MTGNPTGKVRRKRIFAAADEVPRGARQGRQSREYPRKFSQFPPEAGLFLKKAF
jgi:hypothetical protein